MLVRRLRLLCLTSYSQLLRFIDSGTHRVYDMVVRADPLPCHTAAIKSSRRLRLYLKRGG